MTGERSGRLRRVILGLTRVRIALGALMTSQLVMIGTTSTAAVYLHDQGHGVEIIGFATAMHLGGMYIASPITGWLVDRVGRLPVIFIGSLVLIGGGRSSRRSRPGSEGLLVSAGAVPERVRLELRVRRRQRPAHRRAGARGAPQMQGLADLLTGLMGALGSTLGGMILRSWGFAVLNVVGLVLVVGPW